MNTEEWKESYFNDPKVDVMTEFDENEKTLLKKLGIKLEDKIYSEYEFEKLNGVVISYYFDEDMSKEEKKECKKLPRGISREEYNSLVAKLNKINLKFKF